jgi:MinD-like ATPase involved in chromosome partitioning or flagellar assembly
VGVIGAKGGIGTSSLAASLAVRAQERSVQSCVVDLQFASPIDVIFSMEQAPGVRWGSLDHAKGDIDAEKLNSQLLDYNGVKILSSSINYPKLPEREVVTDVLRALKKTNEMIFIDTPKSMITKEYGSEGLLHLVDRFLVLSTRDLESVLAAKAVVNLIGNKHKAVLATFFPRNAKNSGTLSLDNVREFMEMLPMADMSYENKIEQMLRGDGGPEFKKRGHYRDALDSLLEVLIAEAAMTF